MSGNPRTGIASKEDCVNVCSTVNGCKGLTFKADTKRCWLKTATFTDKTAGYVTDYSYVSGSINMDCLFGKPGKQELF